VARRWNYLPFGGEIKAGDWGHTPFADQMAGDSQRWNLNGYVRNNALRYAGLDRASKKRKLPDLHIYVAHFPRQARPAAGMV